MGGLLDDICVNYTAHLLFKSYVMMRHNIFYLYSLFILILYFILNFILVLTLFLLLLFWRTSTLKIVETRLCRIISLTPVYYLSYEIAYRKQLVA